MEKMDRGSLDAQVVAGLKDGLGEDATFRMMVWPDPFDREEGLGLYLRSPEEKGWTIDDALDEFWDKVDENMWACLELHVNESARRPDLRGMAICCGGEDDDVSRPEWLNLDKFGFAPGKEDVQ